MQPLDNSLGIPAFLSKLWKMVDDPETDDLICWSEDGKTFIIKNEAGFWYSLLPVYYKHNNMSSFVRQLNMYGFHKVSNLDNGTVESDKIEYQFLHPFFLRGQPQLLKNIKRKVTNSKVITSNDKVVNNLENTEQLGKVISDVKYLYGRQAQVDSVLSNLKQENSVLWRELAVLRQKHQKQQQIVNKLIQFLVTIVQPSTRMGGLGVKRRYPLMINENPIKKGKSSTSDGPTIHELDSPEVFPEELFEGDPEIQDEMDMTVLNPNIEKVESPMSSQPSQTRSPIALLPEEDISVLDPEINLNIDSTNSELVNCNTSDTAVNVDALLTDPELLDDTTNINSLPVNDEFENEETTMAPATSYNKVFLNPMSQDALLTNLINGSCNGIAVNSSKNITGKKDGSSASSDTSNNMTVATRDPNLTLTRINSVEDIDNHVGATQNELDQLKEFFNGCSVINTTCLLNLFNDAPSYGLIPSQVKEELPENVSDILGGLELAPYDSNIVDFNELFDDSADATDFLKPEAITSPNTDADETINTPDVSNLKPAFPSTNSSSVPLGDTGQTTSVLN